MAGPPRSSSWPRLEYLDAAAPFRPSFRRAVPWQSAPTQQLRFARSLMEVSNVVTSKHASLWHGLKIREDSDVQEYRRVESLLRKRLRKAF